MHNNLFLSTEVKANDPFIIANASLQKNKIIYGKRSPVYFEALFSNWNFLWRKQNTTSM